MGNSFEVLPAPRRLYPPTARSSAEGSMFLTDARTSVDNVVGGLGAGARVALTLLGFERGAGGLASAAALSIELDRLVTLATACGRHTEQDIRLRIADCWTRVHALRCVALTVLSAGAGGTGEVGPMSSIVKTLTAEYHQRVTELALDVLGMHALAPQGVPAVEWLRPQPSGFEPLSSSAWVSDYLSARAGTIYGGSSEIQRNTIAEQLLGLPREPRMRIEARR
jgi:alkylation response protein AidB-like acyl-CoA dehydrogenase